MASPDQASPAEPWWLRERLLPHLELPADLPVHFVGEKTVTATDLDARQSRFRLPSQGVLRSLQPILNPRELQAANLHAPEQAGKHGVRGLPVRVVDARAGIIKLVMSSSESGRCTSLKGEGYLEFITKCIFTVGDVVQIWAFKPGFSPLYLVIARKPKTATRS